MDIEYGDYRITAVLKDKDGNVKREFISFREDLVYKAIELIGASSQMEKGYRIDLQVAPGDYVEHDSE